MNRIIIIVISVLLVILSGIHPLHAQSDSIKKQVPVKANHTDSEKTRMLTHESEEYQSDNAELMEDSIRLLQLKYDLLQLGANDNAKKQSIAAERDQIIIKDSLRKVRQRLK